MPLEKLSGSDGQEFSEKSPLRQLKSFPMELVLLGRASVLVKGVAARLGVPWSVATKWKPLAQDAIAALCREECRLPAWALPVGSAERLRFGAAAKGCAQLVRRWGLEKAASLLAKAGGAEMSEKEKAKERH